jgi:hypothetical protein
LVLEARETNFAALLIQIVVSLIHVGILGDNLINLCKNRTLVLYDFPSQLAYDSTPIK